MAKLLLFLLATFESLNNLCSATNRSQLFKDILDSHEVRVAPFDTVNDRIVLSITINLMSIRKVNEKEQTFSASFWISMSWGDYRFMWDSTSYKGITELQTTSKYVWIPSSICIFNDVTDKKCLTEEKPITIHNTGYLVYTTSRESITQCKIDIKKYPFDSQVCSLYFGNFFTSSEFIDLGTKYSSYSLTYYEQNEEWNVDDFGVTSMNNQLAFSLSLKRKPEFIVLTVLLPVIILSVLNIFAFVLPIDSGEKMGTSMAIFLSFAVFLSTINDTMPKSDEIPPFTVYLTIQLVVSGLTVVLEAVVLHVHFSSCENENKSDNKIVPADLLDMKDTDHKIVPADLDVKDTLSQKDKSIKNLINFVKTKITAKCLDRIFMILVILVDVISLIVFISQTQ
ncbi:acetylcholine receptor subunit alpha-L1-like [Saccostrea echinata]|uniref:acetylcholine receptor subunit alpha-L1-like n=1 Tax=Saccostrea echinata TaxID=191078 RepID=UPI002A8404B6|nr:acetylcholine receptor subunit alpha-L1-like [Saccostrea echinata]